MSKKASNPPPPEYRPPPPGRHRTNLTVHQRAALCEVIGNIYMEGYQCGMGDEDKFYEAYLADIESALNEAMGVPERLLK
jgi:hypothetical protein